MSSKTSQLPGCFVYADEFIPDIVLDLKYCTNKNFVGEIIEGYGNLRLILTEPATRVLLKVQQELRLFDLKLKVFDAYRPQRAVNHFIRWAKDESDYSTQKNFFPGLNKQQLFEENYLAKQSSHSRGSTLDLTLVTEDDKELDMGTEFDFFGPESWPQWPDASSAQKQNRLMLRGIMGKYGFIPHDYEWWHFTLKDEPYPDTYFDFEID